MGACITPLMNDERPNSLARPVFLTRTVVVVPALNEELSVADVAGYWRGRGAGLVRVVDNGSTDGTAEQARSAGAEVLFEPRRGYGAAAWRGTLNLPAHIEWMLFSAADGSDRLDGPEAAAFQSAMDGGADLVLGERTSLAASQKSLGAAQRLGNRLGCRLLALGWKHSFRDMASLRLIRRTAFDRLRLADRGFGWNVEMQVRAVEEGLRVVELPVRCYPRVAGRPKISGHPLGIVRASWGILSTLAKLWCSRGQRLQNRQADEESDRGSGHRSGVSHSR